jgi:hypothetical protein
MLSPKFKSNHSNEPFFKEYNLNANDFKTKKDLREAYYKLTPERHPNVAVSYDGFVKLQKHWSDIKESDYFHKLAALFKVPTIESGPRSNLPNAWKTKGHGLGGHSDIPLAKGLIKMSQQVTRRESWTQKHPLLAGGIALTGGIAAADMGVNAYKVFAKSEGAYKTLGSALKHGAVEGVMYGGILSAAEPVILHGGLKKRVENK